MGLPACVQIHGIIMSVAWGLLIPTGVLVSRYGKSSAIWFHAHRLIQVRLGAYVVPTPGSPRAGQGDCEGDCASVGQRRRRRAPVADCLRCNSEMSGFKS